MNSFFLTFFFFFGGGGAGGSLVEVGMTMLGTITIYCTYQYLHRLYLILRADMDKLTTATKKLNNSGPNLKHKKDEKLFYFLGYGQDVPLSLAGEDYSVPGDTIFINSYLFLFQETERMYLSLSQENIIQFQVERLRIL